MSNEFYIVENRLIGLLIICEMMLDFSWFVCELSCSYLLGIVGRPKPWFCHRLTLFWEETKPQTSSHTKYKDQSITASRRTAHIVVVIFVSLVSLTRPDPIRRSSTDQCCSLLFSTQYSDDQYSVLSIQTISIQFSIQTIKYWSVLFFVVRYLMHVRI